MRTATWLLVLVLVGAIARAEPASGTVIVSCNEVDASLLVDGILIPERTPAVLTLPPGTHVIEARKPPLLTGKQVVDVRDGQQVKVRFDLLPPPPPPIEPPATGTGSAAPPGSGSAAPPATGSAARPATGSGSAAPPATGSGSAAPPATGSAAPSPGTAVAPAAIPAAAPAAKAARCTEGGHEVACIQGPHCTEGGKLVPCKKGDPLPAAAVPPPPVPAAAALATTTAGAGSNAEPPAVSPGAAAIEIVTAAPHAVAYIDGAPIRDAPCVLEVEPGEHVVAVYAAGMIPAEAVVRVAAAQRQRVELTPTTPRRRIDVPAQ
jgi:hypothetical protein